MNFSIFSVWLGQPNDQVTVVLVRWMGTALRFWTVMLKFPLPPSVKAPILIRAQLLVAVGVGVLVGVLVLVGV